MNRPLSILTLNPICNKLVKWVFNCEQYFVAILYSSIFSYFFIFCGNLKLLQDFLNIPRRNAINYSTILSQLKLQFITISLTKRFSAVYLPPVLAYNIKSRKAFLLPPLKTSPVDSIDRLLTGKQKYIAIDFLSRAVKCFTRIVNSQLYVVQHRNSNIR